MMTLQESPHLSSDKRIWSQIYGTLKEMLKSQRSQIETLINDRKFLEANINIQHEHWSSRARFLESHIAHMRDEQAKTRLVEDAKMSVFLGFKESEALCYKMQLEVAESDLEEFRSCVEAVNAELEELKEKLKVLEVIELKNSEYSIDGLGSSENPKGRNQLTMSLKKEIKKLKHANRELSTRRDAEVSALLAEKDFVWNQFRKMESDYIALLKNKHTEADHQAREASQKLQNKVENLQQEIREKDGIIAKLEGERAILELDVRKHFKEAEQANNKMRRLHTDMDELRLEAMEKQKLIDILREDLCNLKTDLKKNSIEKSCYSKKIKSELKSKNGSSTFRQVYLQRCSSKRNLERCSSKRNLESCDIHTDQKHENSCGITYRTPASEKVHRVDQGSIEKKKITLFRSDFKVPKLKRPRQLIP